MIANTFANEIDRMADEILGVGRILCTGAGHEGLMVRALCMRLMHLGSKPTWLVR